MFKLKPLMPSLKERNRYLVLEVVSETKIDDKRLKESIITSVLKFLGELELAKAGLKIIDLKNNKIIIKATHLYVDKIKTALILIKKIDNKNIIIKTVNVTGSLKKARLKMED